MKTITVKGKPAKVDEDQLQELYHRSYNSSVHVYRTTNGKYLLCHVDDNGVKTYEPLTEDEAAAHVGSESDWYYTTDDGKAFLAFYQERLAEL